MCVSRHFTDFTRKRTGLAGGVKALLLFYKLIKCEVVHNYRWLPANDAFLIIATPTLTKCNFFLTYIELFFIGVHRSNKEIG